MLSTVIRHISQGLGTLGVARQDYETDHMKLMRIEFSREYNAARKAGTPFDAVSAKVFLKDNLNRDPDGGTVL